MSNGGVPFDLIYLDKNLRFCNCEVLIILVTFLCILKNTLNFY